jgi:hypothetical protein
MTPDEVKEVLEAAGFKHEPSEWAMKSALRRHLEAHSCDRPVLLKAAVGGTRGGPHRVFSSGKREGFQPSFCLMAAQTKRDQTGDRRDYAGLDGK